MRWQIVIKKQKKTQKAIFLRVHDGRPSQAVAVATWLCFDVYTRPVIAQEPPWLQGSRVMRAMHARMDAFLDWQRQMALHNCRAAPAEWQAKQQPKRQ